MPDLFDIHNCPLDYYCAQDWDTLIPTKDDGYKYCTVCKENVRFCKTYEEFEKQAENGHCVAFMSFSHEDIEKIKESPFQITVGIPKRK
jgi:hypothetical protein